MYPWEESVEAFCAAGEWFAATVPARKDTWGLPALGVWTVRDLVGHTSRALLTVETYLQDQASTVHVSSPADYVSLATASVGDPPAVAQRGRDAGAALGDDLTGAVRALVARITALVRDSGPDAFAATPVGAMRLEDYLPTRTFELTVHTCDLAVALDQPAVIPEPSAAQSLRLIADLALRQDQGAALLLAGTGRRPLPSGFTLL